MRPSQGKDCTDLSHTQRGFCNIKQQGVLLHVLLLGWDAGLSQGFLPQHFVTYPQQFAEGDEESFDVGIRLVTCI